MALIAFFVYWCTSSKFIMQNCHLVEVLDVPIYGSGTQLCGPGHLNIL